MQTFDVEYSQGIIPLDKLLHGDFQYQERCIYLMASESQRRQILVGQCKNDNDNGTKNSDWYCGTINRYDSWLDGFNAARDYHKTNKYPKYMAVGNMNKTTGSTISIIDLSADDCDFHITQLILAL